MLYGLVPQRKRGTSRERLKAWRIWVARGFFEKLKDLGRTLWRQLKGCRRLRKLLRRALIRVRHLMRKREEVYAEEWLNEKRKATMSYKGVVQGNVVLLEEGVTLPEGTQVEVTPVTEPTKGSPAALLAVWGSDVPDEGWDAVEKAVEELDLADREYERKPRRA